jgi:hypothetical protein
MLFINIESANRVDRQDQSLILLKKNRTKTWPEGLVLFSFVQREKTKRDWEQKLRLFFANDFFY